MGWGVVSSRRGLRNIEWMSYGLFVVLLGMSWSVIYALYRSGG